MGPRGMAQQVGAFDALLEGQSLVPSFHVKHFTTTRNSSPWGSDKLFWMPQARHLCMGTTMNTLINNTSFFKRRPTDVK